MALKWSRDGDQYVAIGRMGEYRITEWMLRDGSDFSINVVRKDGARKSIGGFSSLIDAKETVRDYDEYGLQSEMP